MIKAFVATSWLTSLSLLVQPAEAAVEAAAGKAAFDNQCAACHTDTAGQNGFGPSLAQVFGRRSGGLSTYKYSSAMSNAGLVWDVDTLDSFLTASTKKVPGTAMQVAIEDKTIRDDVIAYLATLGTAPAPRTKASASSSTPLIAGPTSAELLGAARDSKNWLYASKDYQGQRFSASKEVTVANASKLHAVCIYRSDTVSSMQTTPLVYDGVMYITMDTDTVALDAKTCRIRWDYNWAMQGGALSKANRGVAIKDGRLIRGTPDGYLIALSMSDGTLLWSRKIADSKVSQYLSMPPMIFDDEIIYGTAGADWGSKNWVGGFDLRTGVERWRFNLVPDAGEPGADTWSDSAARAHGGGSVWTPLSLDVGKGVLYLPVGNPAPDFFEAARPGDNLYTNSAVALDMRTGKLLWFHQFGPADSHDRDLSQVSPLFTAVVDGKPRNLIAISGKDGLLRVLDRDSHAQLFETSITTRTGWEVDPAVGGAHSCPGLLGGVEYNGPAYSPTSHTLYVSAVDWCATFTRTEKAPQYAPNAHYYGGAATPDPRDQARGWIRALDSTTGKDKWKREWPTPLVAGITVTGTGVLFSGDLDDNFFALDARTGRTLYTFNTGGAVGGGVISYEINGKQYVASTSGTVSGFFGGGGTAAIVVFALP